VGLFGLLGSGNIGNDASMDVVLRYLRTDHPDAIVDAMCRGPEEVKAKFGIDAVPLLWSQKYEGRVPGVTAKVVKLLGKGVDAFHTASWVRRHDAVIVPGMGALEASLPLRPWQTPYAMFLLCASGRIAGTKVAMVSVGANMINPRMTRWLFNLAARNAFYRSYRDQQSCDAMRQRGLDTSKDRVYPDLVFALPAPPFEPGDPDTVGLGVMAYYGTNDDRQQANEIHAAYVAKMQRFTRWLVDHNRKVRLFVGDSQWDDSVVRKIVADVREYRPDLDQTWVVAERVTSFADLTRAMRPASIVVATRYHNVMCALKLEKPVISIGYAAKNAAIMADAGLADFCQHTNTLDVDRLIQQFTELESRSAEVRKTIAERNAGNARLLDQQFAELSALLFPASGARTAPGREDAPAGARSRSLTRAPAIVGRARDRHTQEENVMNDPIDGIGAGSEDSSGTATKYYKKDFWSEENLKYSRPHFRLEKSARIIGQLAQGRERSLLDVGCGPATLMHLLPSNIRYHGIDISIPDPGPNLIESDILSSPIEFDGRKFDIVLAQGVFEYMGEFQSQKFAEIARLLNKDGIFVLSYVNFGHREKIIYWPYNNMQSFGDFRQDLMRYFTINRFFPTSHNWKHSEPNRRLVKAANMHLNANIPVISPLLAVEYFLICSPGGSQAPAGRS
jgi:polysaccharide pyruvyl transferase WcaK-like protein/SAM-dependent methyltransferase